MEEFTAYTVERIKGKKQLVFNISCDVVFNSFKTLKYAQRSKAIALYAAVLNSIVTIYVIGTIYMTKNN